MMTGNKLSYDRYQRQIILKELGVEGQQKLANARVLVVGAGGLGCPVLLYLAGAGVGTIGLIDDDVVSLHNLHRQVLYQMGDLGRKKAEVAASRLQAINPEIRIEPYVTRLTNQNAAALLTDYDVVVDATDNFATRYCVNDACVLLDKPLVYGAIAGFEGQVALFNATAQGGVVNYRDLFPDPPDPGAVLNCAEAGVLGVLPGLIGTLQATEVLKLLTGIGRPLVDQLFTYNALTNESLVFGLSARSDTASHLPKTFAEFEGRNYDFLCDAPVVNEMDLEAFQALLHTGTAALIDVREVGELPVVTEFRHRRMPLSVLSSDLPEIDEDQVVVFCQSGKRSREAARILSTRFGNRKKIYSLQGGITNWMQHGKENT